MIESFNCKETEKLFFRERSRRFPPEILRVAQRKLAILHAVEYIDDLRIPPGNRLEKLKGDREGQYSIRINDQWRICFVWELGQAKKVEIVDYHKG